MSSNIDSINITKNQSYSKRTNNTTKKASRNLLSQNDYLNIYKDLTVLFIGDNSIRIRYRDLCKIFKFGRLLEYTETECQNGNYQAIEGKLKTKVKSKKEAALVQMNVSIYDSSP
jgi:hypothetical protein